MLALVQHVRQHAELDGVGFQTHIWATGLNTTQFESSIKAALADGLRFSITENDCAIHEPSQAGQPTVVQQEINQGREYGPVVGLCVKYGKSCDAYQIWGATDDGSWLPNQEATPVTRWVADTRPGPTQGKMGYWPKEGQYDPDTEYDPKTSALDRASGHIISNAYDQIWNALKSAKP